jgi:class 3 adenylate cyclase
MSENTHGGHPSHQHVGGAVANIILSDADKNDLEFRRMAEEVGIIFIDLVGSTAYKRRHGQQAGIRKIFALDCLIDEIVYRTDYDGEIIKFVGDGAMVRFRGLDRISRMVQAGLEIIRRLEDQNREKPWEEKSIIRIGAHVGPVWHLGFKESNMSDPHGTTVDYAARLCGIAPGMQILVSEAVVQKLRENTPLCSELSVSDEQSYRLKGIEGAQRLFTVARGAAAAVIPHLGHYTEPLREVRWKIDTAMAAWEEHQDIDRAIRELRNVVASDPTVFEANYRLAELLVVHHPNDHANRPNRLEEAYHCLCEAKGERQSSYVWKLLSWIKYQQFLESGGTTAELLNSAIDYCEQGRILAKSQMDEFGTAIAKVYLIIYLNERYGLDKIANIADHQQAQRYVTEVDLVIDDGLGKWLESNFLVGKAMTKAAVDGASDEVLNLLADAHKANVRSRLAATVTDRLLNG